MGWYPGGCHYCNKKAVFSAISLVEKHHTRDVCEDCVKHFINDLQWSVRET